MAVTLEQFTPNTTAGSAIGTSSVNWGSIYGSAVYDGNSRVARLASPTLTGTPLAPTAGAGTNTTQIATTAFVTSALAAANVITSSAQITDGIVALADQADVAAWTMAGRNDAATGVPQAVAAASIATQATPTAGMFLFGFTAAGAWQKYNYSVIGGTEVADDTSPQLGGHLDVNGQVIGDGTRTLLSFVEDASAANYLEIENNEAASAPILRATGSDTNVSLNLVTKGAGTVQANGVDLATISSIDTLTNKSISGADNTVTALPTTALDANAVTNAKLAQPAAWKAFKGNATAGAADPTDWAPSDLTAETTPTSTDLVVVEMVSGSGEIRKVTLANLSTALAGSDTQAKDAVGGILTDTNSVLWTYTSATSIEANLHVAGNSELTAGTQGQISIGSDGAYAILGTNSKTAGRGDFTPTTGEKDALGGGPGTASSTNFFVQADYTDLTAIGTLAGADLVSVWDIGSSVPRKATITEVVALAAGGGGGGGGDSMSWDFSTTTTDADPGANTFRANNATPASITFLYVDDLATHGLDVGAMLLTLDIGDRLYIEDASSNGMEFTLSGVPTDGTGYWKIPVTHVVGATLFTNADTCTFRILAKGAVIDTQALVSDPADRTKRVRLDAGLVTTATTRIAQAPNHDAKIGRVCIMQEMVEPGVAVVIGDTWETAWPEAFTVEKFVVACSDDSTGASNLQLSLKHNGTTVATATADTAMGSGAGTYGVDTSMNAAADNWSPGALVEVSVDDTGQGSGGSASEGASFSIIGYWDAT